ncbi:MAG: carboxylating nicotinate-nucleotide diphosphorylase [Methanotrichaceae archaeon]
MLWSVLERLVIEDLGEWDDSSVIVPDTEAEALIFSRERCVISGLEEAGDIMEYFGLEQEPFVSDGDEVSADAEVMRVRGQAKAILQGERLALNFLSRMSGIATLTHDCVRKAGTVRVACTRKTTPGFRIFEKKAVVAGGGDPHRLSLSDAVIIKDNHLKLMGLENAILTARSKTSFTKKIEVEVESLEDLLKAVEMKAEIVMFDNMKPAEIQKGVDLLEVKGLREKVILEASGGIKTENIAEYASTGVDVISLGALTKMANWIDFSLEIERCL